MSLKRIIERTAARKAAGLIPVYNHPKKENPKTPRQAIPLEVLRPPCKFEGSVLSPCTSCGSNEGRHVRACMHQNPSDPDREACTRADVKKVWEDKILQGCSTCPDYQEETSNGTQSQPDPPTVPS